MVTQQEAYIGRLVQWARDDDRRVLAALRRGLGRPPGTAVEMMPFVVPYLPEKPWGHWAYFLTASMFAIHPKHRPGRNMGEVCRRAGDNDSSEKRFLALLDSHQDDLPAHLRRAVSIARQKDVGIDYLQLLRDLLAWDHPDRYVQLNWSRRYWGGGTKEHTDTDIQDKRNDNE